MTGSCDFEPYENLTFLNGFLNILVPGPDNDFFGVSLTEDLEGTLITLDLHPLVI